MTKKASKLINERVIRRWGKLANMPSLTENFIDNLEEEDAMEDEMAAAEDEIAAGEEEVEGGMEAEASVEEQEAVENIVQAVVDAISAETGVEIEVEGGADDGSSKGDLKANDRDYNRKDETLNIDVVDDEALTEVVLKRVVERLLKKK